MTVARTASWGPPVEAGGLAAKKGMVGQAEEVEVQLLVYLFIVLPHYKFQMYQPMIFTLASQETVEMVVLEVKVE